MPLCLSQILHGVARDIDFQPRLHILVHIIPTFAVLYAYKQTTEILYFLT
jgi:hypothetical protein